MNGEVIHCGKPVRSTRTFRASHRMSMFVSMCTDCIGDLHSHRFCPGCGTNCTVAETYRTCSLGHRFHKSCVTLLSVQDRCPHCDIPMEKPLFQEKSSAKKVSPSSKNETSQTNFAHFKFTANEEEKIIKIAEIIFEKRNENFDNFSITENEIQNAIDNSDLGTLAKMLLNGKYIRKGVTKSSMSLFHYATMKNEIAIAEVFLRFGADASEADNTGMITQF